MAALLPSPRHEQLWAEARATILYVENFELIESQLAYGAAGPNTSPFQHFWSLSVQGQFYLVWPVVAVIAVLIAKWLRVSAARVMAILAGAILVLSMGFAIYVGSYNQDESYLMTATRAWQLAFGALLALSISRLRITGSWRKVAGWLGILLIVSCGFVLDGAQLFPSPWALWPLLGLALVLISAGPAGGHEDPTGYATRFLASPLFAWIGDRAYSLYLWHWPLLIVYVQVRQIEEVSFLDGVIVLGATFVLAWLTHRFIETPLQGITKRPATRGLRSDAGAVLAGVSSMVVLALVMTALPAEGRAGSTSTLDPGDELHPGAAQYFLTTQVPEAEVFPAPEDANMYRQEYLGKGCAQKMGEDPGTDVVTVCEDEDAPEEPTATVVLAGGSHAGHYQGAFETLARKHGWEVLVVIKSSCLFGWETRPDQEMCGAWNSNFIEWLGDNDVDLVVTAGTRQDADHDTEYIVDDAPLWWERIAGTGTDLLLLRGTPRHYRSMPECLAEGGTPQECGPSKSKFLEDNPLESLNLGDRVRTMDLTKYICPRMEEPEYENCDAVVGNVLVSFDNSHFSTPFSESLAPAIEAELMSSFPSMLK
ncbi:acyltransferase family protein [Micrococcus terreus]|uniref:acyltransferase family protein n=1 Tax=Micrococcus terreus TaxID=574650 RepID=UPI00254F8389|nr:acyltransferase family protein [Micrococcus terreus]MDK7702448.1 acyltransferase family protein [Micrococcus terreus]WOO98679.1 acyltransferase family protein [Micrococcus terreus]